MADVPSRTFAERLREPRVLWALAGGALLLVVVLLGALALSHRGGAAVPASASSGELQIEAGRATSTGATASLRCFVGGQMVGEMALGDCAARNGVSSQALDVGLPPPAAPASAEPTPSVEPSPQVSDLQRGAQPSVQPAQPPVVTADAGSGDEESRGQCLSYAGGGWRAARGGAGSLKGCVHALYDGRCVRAGEALYGRYGALTLRLVPGRVEIASDNRSFRPLVGQTTECSIDD